MTPLEDGQPARSGAADGPLLRLPADERSGGITVGDHRLSVEQLSAAAAVVAGEIAGAPAVALRATPSLATIVGVVAAVAAGVPLVPVPADSAPPLTRYLVRDSGAAIWLGPRFDGVDLDAVPLDPAARGGGIPQVEPDADRIALVVYTSGTTGMPKGVALSRRAVAAGLDGLAEAWHWQPDDVLVHGLPLGHVHGLVLGVLGPLRWGTPLIHTVRPDPARYAAAMASGGTVAFGVPTVWRRMADDPASAAACARARLLVSGSAALPAVVATRLAACTGQLPVERYGMTETRLIPIGGVAVV